MPFLSDKIGPPGASSHQDIPIEHGLPPAAPSDNASLQQNQSFTSSEDDIEKRFRVPKEAYIEVPGGQDICSAWGDYLDVNNHRRAFQSLRGTEQDRYEVIIRDAKAKEAKRRGLVFETMKIIEAGGPLIDRFLATLQYPNLPANYGVEKPNSDGSPAIRERCIRDISTLDEGYNKLSHYLKFGAKHTRRYPEFFKANYNTKYGRLAACTILPIEEWYVGHRPGDPIVRVKDNPIGRQINEGDMFYVYDLAGLEDGDEPERYSVRCEGVVPFNTEEIYQRFTQFAFPAFVRMAIAIVGFDPRDIKRGADFWAKVLEDLHTTGFEEFSKRDRAKLFKLVRRIWHAKYGNEPRNFPRFLRAQISSSISCLREMGWLMSRLERDAPRHARHHYWNHCKALLRDFTLCDARMLAQEYFDITLANEANYLLSKGEVGEVFVYRQRRTVRAQEKVRVIFSPNLLFRTTYSSSPFLIILA
ncbi:hypothetical protein GGR51DRAFT_538406 [Nemania sp. FL0031]|nr:hypothetical protein GGR51DRAFT_538406 [Nemania sp. FL0031]